MKKELLSIIGVSILGLGLFYAYQTDVLGDIFINSNLNNSQVEVEMDHEDAELPLEEDFIQKTQGTIIAATEDEFLFIQRLNLSESEIASFFEESTSDEFIYDLMRLSNIDEALEVGTEIEIAYTIATRSLPPLVPVQSYEVIN